MQLEKFNFGWTTEQQEVSGYRAENINGLSIAVINWGATLFSVKTADRTGKFAEITLGLETISDYEKYSPYFGSTVGRVANRIAAGRFSIGPEQYQLQKNEKEINHLHGGLKGISKVIWEITAEKNDESAIINCFYHSADGEEGYPGNFDVKVSYTLTNSDELMIEYQATTDKTCPVNLTNHTYWNLSGDKETTILEHELSLKCEAYLPVDDDLIPTGEIKPVTETPWDFRETKTIGKDIEAAAGYDHCFVIGPKSTECKETATVFDPSSGREMTVLTTEPGVQFYSGNFLFRKEEQGFKTHDGFCLETQGFPNAVNQKEFPSVLLNPGEVYHQKTIHQFKVR